MTATLKDSIFYVGAIWQTTACVKHLGKANIYRLTFFIILNHMYPWDKYLIWSKSSNMTSDMGPLESAAPLNK